MQSPEEEFFESESPSSPKLAAAARDVQLAQAQLRADLQSASRAGQRLTKTIVKSARPVLIGVALLTGAGLIVTLWRSRRRARPALPMRASSASSSSLWWEIGRAAVVALASSAGKHLANKLAEPIVADLNAGTPSLEMQGPRPPADS